jgi:hypothetical protein
MAPQLPPLLPRKLLSLADRLQTGQKLLWPSSALATLGGHVDPQRPHAPCKIKDTARELR